MTAKVEVSAEPFVHRDLTLWDIPASCLASLSDCEAGRWIAVAVATRKISDLGQYVLELIGRDDIILLGIFDLVSNF